MTEPQNPPPGWYDDPYGAPMLRWWDGTTWTEQTAPVPTEPGPTRSANGLDDIGTWLSDTFRRLRGRIGDVFVVIAMFQVITGLVVGLGLWLALRGFRLEFTEAAGGDDVAVDVDGVTAGVLGGLVVFAAAMFGFAGRGAVTHQLAAADHEPALPWSASLAHGLRRLPRLIGVAILTGLGLLVIWAAAIVPAAFVPILFILTIPAAIVATIWWFVRSNFFGTAAVLVPRGTSAIRTSFALTKNRVFAIFGRLLLLGLITFAASLAANVVTAPINAIAGFDNQFAAAPGETPPWLIESDNGFVIEGSELVGAAPFALLVGLIVGGLATGFVYAISDSGHLSLYRQLDGPVDDSIDRVELLD